MAYELITVNPLFEGQVVEIVLGPPPGNIVTSNLTGEFMAAVDHVFGEIRASTPLPGADPIRIPGETRQATIDERRENGIPMHPNLIKALNAVADELAIEPINP